MTEHVYPSGGREQHEHTITTLKGSFSGPLLSCLEWQAENQGAMPAIDGINIDDLNIAHADDPYREEGDITPEEARWIVRQRLAERTDTKE